MPFTWTRSLTLAVASDDCAVCEGTGMLYLERRARPCRCALRGIFRACYARWSYIESGNRMSQVQYGIRETPESHASFSMPDVEYAADFVLVSRRALTSPLEQAIFRLHFLLGLDWRGCCRRLGLDKGSFYHAAYRIEERLGRAYAETAPYPLFPLDAYFAGVRYKPDTSLPTSEMPIPLQSAA